MIHLLFLWDGEYGCMCAFLFSLMTYFGRLCETACFRSSILCKTKTNNDALEVVDDFDDHCGLFATSLSSTNDLQVNLFGLAYAICSLIKVLDEI